MKKINIMCLCVILILLLSSIVIAVKPTPNPQNQYYIFGDNTDAVPHIGFNWTNNETYIYPYNESIWYRNETNVTFDLANISTGAGADGYAGAMGHPHDQDLNITDDVIFNWVTAQSFFGDGGNLTNVTGSENFSPIAIFTAYGTVDAGDLNSVITPEDDDSYNVSEDTGAYPVLQIYINFTGITTFDSVIGRLWYNGGLGHEINFQIYNNDTAIWENYLEFTDTSDFINFYVPVFDPEKHVKDSYVYLRFDHEDSGIPSHDLYIDYISIVDGFTALTVAEHDGLGGRDNKTNHPWAMPTDASRNFTDNLFCEQFLTAVSFFGDGGNLTNITATGDGYAGATGHPHNQDLNITNDVSFRNITSRGNYLSPYNYDLDSDGGIFLGDGLLNSIYNDSDLGLTFSGISRGANIITSGGAKPDVLVNTDGIITIPYQPASRVKMERLQNVPSNIWTRVVLDSEDYDQNSDFAFSRFVAPANGLYHISYSVLINGLNVGTIFTSGIYINGALAGGYKRTVAYASVGTADVSNTATDIIQLSTSDYIELWVFHNHPLVTRALPVFDFTNYMVVCKIA